MAAIETIGLKRLKLSVTIKVRHIIPQHYMYINSIGTMGGYKSLQGYTDYGMPKVVYHSDFIHSFGSAFHFHTYFTAYKVYYICNLITKNLIMCLTLH